MSLSPAQERALVQIAAGDLSGIRSVTFGALVGQGLITVTHGEVSVRFRPAPRGFTRERWSRTRTILTSAKLTPTGAAWLAARAAASTPG